MSDGEDDVLFRLNNIVVIFPSAQNVRLGQVEASKQAEV